MSTSRGATRHGSRGRHTRKTRGQQRGRRVRGRRWVDASVTEVDDDPRPAFSYQEFLRGLLQQQAAVESLHNRASAAQRHTGAGMAYQVTMGRFIGRIQELARLRELLVRATTGEPLVAGGGGGGGG